MRSGGTFEIPLTRGLVALVDAEDFARFGGDKWYATNHAHGRSYAARKPWSTKRLEYLHRAIMDAPAEMQVDHINGDRLDNRRRNLRLCTRSENLLNQGPRSGRYRGVSYDAKNNKWIAQISRGSSKVWLGRWSSEVEAARVYDYEARILFGEFARLNFPEAA